MVNIVNGEVIPPHEKVADVPRPIRVSTYEEVAGRAKFVRALLAGKNICIHRDSALGTILREAEKLAENWVAGRTDGGIRQLVNAAHANRIAEAIEMTSSEPTVNEALRRMAGNDMNLSGRSPSQGKDALWELDFVSFLRRRNVIARLEDPPDIVAQFDFGDYAIACKKIYSERGVEAQVRKGAKQLSRFGGAGIVAINIDDLVPEDALLQSATQDHAGDFLAKFNGDFIERHRARIQRFVIDGRCDGVLVSTTVLSDIVRSDPRFNLCTEATMWSVEGLERSVVERVASVRRSLEM